jgi:hypothetical protein
MKPVGELFVPPEMPDLVGVSGGVTDTQGIQSFEARANSAVGVFHYVASIEYPVDVRAYLVLANRPSGAPGNVYPVVEYYKP